MFTEEEKERYSRQLILDGFGALAQQKLKQAKVFVIGAGGLGCPALIYLVSAGMGAIGIADDDKVALSNLPRQVLYATGDVGKYKVNVAKIKLNEINPHCNIITCNERITRENVLQIVKEYDVIVDCSDNFQARYLINDACVILNKPFIYGAISGFEGQVSVFNYKNGPTYRCLFPEPPNPGDAPSCNEMGVVGVLPGIIGILQATETIKIIACTGNVLSGKLLTIDLLNNHTAYFDIAAIEANKNIKELGTEEYYCNNSVKEISMEVYYSWNKQKKVQLIDVRTPEEYKLQNLGGINIPLADLKNELNKIDNGNTIVVHCKTGRRARKAIEIIREEFKNADVFLLNAKFDD